MRYIPDSAQITELLHKIRNGDPDAERELAPLVYDDLRRLARNCMRKERRDHTLQTTGLVHEAYLRLIGRHNAGWEDRIQFFSVAAGLMRRILIDYARTRNASKRGGGVAIVSLDGIEPGSRESWDKIIDVHDALCQLAAVDSRAARVVELRFFGGLDIEDIAELMGVSGRTVKRDWEFAQSWLFARIAESYGGASPSGKTMSLNSTKSRLSS